MPKSPSIIDVDCGDSRLIDFLLDEGFGNLTVLYISAKGLQRAKQRLGEKAEKVNWIVSDVTDY